MKIPVDEGMCRCLVTGLQNALGSGFRGQTRCPVWLLPYSEATIIPLGKGDQTNPIYSGKPGEASSEIIPNWRCEIDARGFVLGQMNGQTFLSAEVHSPSLGTHGWSIGWINIWQGTFETVRGTLYCQVLPPRTPRPSSTGAAATGVSSASSWGAAATGARQPQAPQDPPRNIDQTFSQEGGLHQVPGQLQLWGNGSGQLVNQWGVRCDAMGRVVRPRATRSRSTAKSQQE